jgi:hypothetical protein
MNTHSTNCERLFLLPRFYAMGRLSNTGDGFQLGYRWLSVRRNGPSVARSLCRRETKSCGLAAILASSSDTGMYVTSSFFPVFSSYALNTSLNDYGFLSCQTPSESECQVRRYLIVPSDGKGTVLQFFGWKMCQDIGNISGNIGPGRERKRLVAIATNGHFPAREIEVNGTLDLWLTGQNRQRKKYIMRRTEAKSHLRTRQCRRRCMAVPKLSALPERSPSPPVIPRIFLLIFLRILKERTT